MHFYPAKLIKEALRFR